MSYIIIEKHLEIKGTELIACIIAFQLSYKERYVKVTRVVQKVYEEMEQYTGQAYLEHKLRVLIAKNDVQYKSDLSPIRLYEENIKRGALHLSLYYFALAKPTEVFSYFLSVNAFNKKCATLARGIERAAFGTLSNDST